MRDGCGVLSPVRRIKKGAQGRPTAFLDLCCSGCSPWTACRLPFPLAAPPASFLTRTPGFPPEKGHGLNGGQPPRWPPPSCTGDVQVFKQSPACSGAGGGSWVCDPLPSSAEPRGGQPVPAWWRCYPAAPGPAGPTARSLPASAAPGGRRGVSKGGNGVGRYVLVLLESGPGLRGFSAAALEMIIFSFWRV